LQRWTPLSLADMPRRWVLRCLVVPDVHCSR
jgi:hypothetical protein